MNTDINTIDEQYTHDTIDYNDAQLGSVISELKTTIEHLETIRSELNSMAHYESSWKGKSKTTYEDLNSFIDQYQKDYLSSVKKLKKTATGLEMLLGSISSSNVIREIDNA
ncbi:hypothetical protein HO594_09575 [Streptococcus suis]|nr:hypothetical protein [Streptococcus suis]